MFEFIFIVAEHGDSILLALGTLGLASEGVLLSLSVLVRALRVCADGLFRLAQLTSADWDDAFLSKLSRHLERLAAWLDGAAAWVPRLRAGRGRDARSGRSPGLTLLVPFLALLGSLALSGCGGGERHARTAIDVGAQTLVAVDARGAEEVRRLESRCDAEAVSLSSWRECMRPAYVFRDALLASRRVLQAAEAAVDARGAEGWEERAPCVASAVSELVEALALLGVPIVEELLQLLAHARAVGGECRGGFR